MRMEQSSMLFPATIISILHALWSGLRWMQHVHSASITFSREVNRYKGKKYKPPISGFFYPQFVCLYVQKVEAERGKLLLIFIDNYLQQLVNWASFSVLRPFGVALLLFIPLYELLIVRMQKWSNWYAGLT